MTPFIDDLIDDLIGDRLWLHIRQGHRFCCTLRQKSHLAQSRTLGDGSIDTGSLLVRCTHHDIDTPVSSHTMGGTIHGHHGSGYGVPIVYRIPLSTFDAPIKNPRHDGAINNDAFHCGTCAITLFCPSFMHTADHHAYSVDHLSCIARGPFLGMDWGRKRVGLAISNPENTVSLKIHDTVVL